MSKRVTFSVNDFVRVQLTDRGREIYASNTEDLEIHVPDVAKHRGIKEDGNGWSQWQLWELMNEFGADTFCGSTLAFKSNIELIVNDTKVTTL